MVSIMIDLTLEDKKTCMGCYACYNVCSINSISMIKDNEGFCEIDVEEREK